MATTNELALVTGATGGIGKATAIALAKRGVSIAVHYNSNESAARDLVSAIEKLGNVKARAFRADLSTYEGARKLHEAVVNGMGQPTILFANSGITGTKIGHGNIQDITPEEFEHTWRTNCGTAFELTRLCLPSMESSKHGRLIFCGSVAGLTGGVIGPHYASSKSALHGLVHWLASRYAKEGITANLVAPALITSTNMVPDEPEALKSKIPVGRLGKPEEIASVVELFAFNAYVTNKIITVDGGLLPR